MPEVRELVPNFELGLEFEPIAVHFEALVSQFLRLPIFVAFY